jgi:hypothetical protein
MLLYIVVYAKMSLSENETLSPFRAIFLLRRPCVCLLRVYVLTSWTYVPCIIINLYGLHPVVYIIGDAFVAVSTTISK